MTALILLKEYGKLLFIILLFFAENYFITITEQNKRIISVFVFIGLGEVRQSQMSGYFTILEYTTWMADQDIIAKLTPEHPDLKVKLMLESRSLEILYLPQTFI